MQFILALFFLFAAIYYPLLFIEWLLRAIGILKPRYEPYSLEQHVLKPLGYTYAEYLVKPGIAMIINVQNKLSQELLKRINEIDWRSVQHDLDENRKMEEEFIEKLKEPLC
jgi:hypothetical protein